MLSLFYCFVCLFFEAKSSWSFQELLIDQNKEWEAEKPSQLPNLLSLQDVALIKTPNHTESGRNVQLELDDDMVLYDSIFSDDIFVSQWVFMFFPAIASVMFKTLLWYGANAS